MILGEVMFVGSTYRTVNASGLSVTPLNRIKERTFCSHVLMVGPRIAHAALQTWSLLFCLPAVCLKAEKHGQECRTGVVKILAAKDCKNWFSKNWPCRKIIDRGEKIHINYKDLLVVLSGLHQSFDKIFYVFVFSDKICRNNLCERWIVKTWSHIPPCFFRSCFSLATF